LKSGLITTRRIMTNSAEIIKFPKREKQEPTHEREYVKADIDNGYYRVANEIGIALCKSHLNDSEGRVVHTVMLKTFGWNKMLDWICYEQISELTGISVDNISKIKKRLVSRKIILTEGKKMGINPVVSEWQFKSKQTKNQDKKISLSRPLNKSKQTLAPIQTDLKISKSRPIQKKDTITIDTITIDIDKNPISPRIKKPEQFKKFFKAYPAHRKGGTDAQAWKVWKSEKFTDEDAQAAFDWITLAAKTDVAWGTDANGQFIFGITNFLRDKKWLTPIPQPMNQSSGKRQSVSDHNAQAADEWLASQQPVIEVNPNER
jgi:phage replication O-like protein O